MTRHGAAMAPYVSRLLAAGGSKDSSVINGNRSIVCRIAADGSTTLLGSMVGEVWRWEDVAPPAVKQT